MIFKMRFLNKLFILFLFVTSFTTASAAVVVNEIMYDPKDTDANTGGEWIEVYNTDSAATDLTKWFFFENDTNHSITADGALEIPSGGYAVISRDLTALKTISQVFQDCFLKHHFH